MCCCFFRCLRSLICAFVGGLTVCFVYFRIVCRGFVINGVVLLFAVSSFSVRFFQKHKKRQQSMKDH